MEHRAGSTLLATYLAGELYQRAMRRHGEEGTCTGSDCFRATFLVVACLALAACAAAVVLWRRSQHLYDRVIAVTREERSKRGLQVRPGVSGL